jgi:hypothetical protein
MQSKRNTNLTNEFDFDALVFDFLAVSQANLDLAQHRLAVKIQRKAGTISSCS